MKYLILMFLTISFSCGHEEIPQEEVVVSSLQNEENQITATASVRAQEGDNVLLIVTYIKEEAKAEYEKFMKEVFFELTSKSKLPLMDDQDQQTRWLLPQRKNDDGTWTYAFFMDPVVQNGNYDFLPLFEESYSKEKSAELMTEYESFMALPPEFHSLVQSNH